MGDVIDFPMAERNFQEMEKWARRLCENAGLDAQMTKGVIEEYRPIHEGLFDQARSQLQVPEGTELSDVQIDELLPAIKKLYVEQTAYAAHIILGLLIRERLAQD